MVISAFTSAISKPSLLLEELVNDAKSAMQKTLEKNIEECSSVTKGFVNITWKVL